METAASPPAPPSPTSSQGSFVEPDLPALVAYLLASKRSLNTTALVLRARDIVTDGRNALEENAILSASNAFARSALGKQVDSLEAIRYGATVVDAEGAAEFTETVRGLDDAIARLQMTLEGLRGTVVEAALRPTEAEPKKLYDFVDEAGIADLEASVKASIDRFEAARAAFADTCEAFERDLDALHTACEPAEGTRQPKEGQVLVEDGETPVPALFYQLETRATDAASHLEGLVKHYDLCVTALKHTEGGGDAITEAVDDDGQQDPELIGLGVDMGKTEAVPTKSLSNEERLNLLHVLVKDADEVDEVVADIRDTLAEMEDGIGQVTLYVDELRETSMRLRGAMSTLRDVTGKLPHYINACAEFQNAWHDEREVLLGKLDELEGLRASYDGFSHAYDKMILEIQRRKSTRRDVDRVLKAAKAELDAIYEEDLHQRDLFRDTHADFIPSDLWPGLVNAPARWRFMQEEDGGDDEIPNLKKSVVETAMRRVKEHGRSAKDRI